ncbi:MAG: hypothetical protein K8U03_20920 [Planctomycetia bacterium]|nr:hypothetical protein [Planctomycetia bacterium]
MSRVKDAKGLLLWESPTDKHASRWVLFAFGALFFVVAIIILVATFSPRDIDRTEMGTRTGIGLSAVCCLIAIAFIARGISPTATPRGVLFYQAGIEFGEMENRRFIKYPDLETYKYFLAEPENDAIDNAVLAARTIVSVIALNPAGIGRSMGEMTREPIYSELLLKHRDEELVTFSLTREVHDLLAPTFKKT